MARKLDALGIAALQEIREARADQDRRVQEFIDSYQPRLHAIRAEAEDALLRAIARARRTPGLSKRSIMEAARTMNWDRWSALEKKSDIYMEGSVESGDFDPIIEYELDREAVLAFNPYILPTTRLFKMREWTYPYTSHVRASHPGTDLIEFWTTHPIQLGKGEGPYNPAWANGNGMPIGEHEAEILSAIKAWIEKHPEAPE